MPHSAETKHLYARKSQRPTWHTIDADRSRTVCGIRLDEADVYADAVPTQGMCHNCTATHDMRLRASQEHFQNEKRKRTTVKAGDLPYFHLIGQILLIAPWLIGGLAFGEAGVWIGVLLSIGGLMMLNDANNKNIERQKRQRR